MDQTQMEWNDKEQNEMNWKRIKQNGIKKCN